MIPRLARRGHSFAKAGAYYLSPAKIGDHHGATWVEMDNLAARDPQVALKLMAWTDRNAEQLKAAHAALEAGNGSAYRPGIGAPRTAGAVQAISWSWHPDQSPSREEMLALARRGLADLGLHEHQALLVPHRDTAHPHIHALVNLVHPETGRMAQLKYSKRVLQRGALAYERETGHIYCRERDELARAREETGRQAREVRPKPDMRGPIKEAYARADTGRGFQTALAEAGLTLAQGRRGRMLAVDPLGNVYALNRQIPGTTAKELRARCRDLELAALPFSGDLQAARREAVRDRGAPPAAPGGANDNALSGRFGKASSREAAGDAFDRVTRRGSALELGEAEDEFERVDRERGRGGRGGPELER